MRGIRAALSIGVSWAIAWSIGGAIFAIVRLAVLLVALAKSDVALPVHEITAMIGTAALFFAIVGGLNGVFFSVVLATLGRRLRDRLRLPLVGAFGALAGAVLPVALSLAFLIELAPDVSGESLGIVGIGALLGCISAMATFAVARTDKSAPPEATGS